MKNSGIRNEQIGVLNQQKLYYVSVINKAGQLQFLYSFVYGSLHQQPAKAISIFEILHPDDVENFKTSIEQCCINSYPSIVEARVNHDSYKLMKWELTMFDSSKTGEEKLLCAAYDAESNEQFKKYIPLLKHSESAEGPLNIGIIFHTAGGKVIAATQKAAEIFNTTLEEIYNNEKIDALWKTKNANDASLQVLNNFTEQNGTVLNFKIHNGHSRYVLINSQPVYEHKISVPSFYLSTVIDLIPEKKFELLVKDKEALFTSFMNHTPNFTWIMDENENVIYANKSLLNYFGLNENILHQNIYKVLPKAIADTVHDKHQTVIEFDRPYTSVLKSVMANGKNHIFQVTAFPIRGTTSGKLVGGEALDITESYRINQQLKKTNERLLYISRVTTEAIWDWNIQQGQIFRNKALQNLIGFHTGEAHNLLWWYQRIHEEDRERVENKIKTVLENKDQTWEEEYRFKCANNEYKTVYDRGFVLYEDGVPTRMIGSLQDVSEIKNLETRLTQEKLNQQKEIAEAIINAQEQERTKIGSELHDNVNQILSVCTVYLGMLKTTDKEQQETKKKTMEFIMLAIDEIRKLSKAMVMPRLKEDGLITNINELVNDIRETELFNIEFIHCSNCDIENISLNKKVTLFRIVQEQLKNILKHSYAKNVQIKLEHTDGHLFLLIKDDGVGFDANKARRGIGLSNIYERTKLYNGVIELNTAPGQGCSLSISIPPN